MQNRSVGRGPLTQAQEKVWAYILGYISDNNYPPTRQEIAEKLECTRGNVEVLLRFLERKGYIKLTPPLKSRNIEIVL